MKARSALVHPAPVTGPSLVPRPAVHPHARPKRRKHIVAIIRIARFWPALQRQTAAAPAAAKADGLEAFGSEHEPAKPIKMAPAPKGPSGKKEQPPHSGATLTALKWIAVIVLSAAAAIAGVILYQQRFGARATTGSLTIETTPAGLDVAIAGKPYGRSPVVAALAPATYTVQVGAPPQQRTFSVNVTAGNSIVQRVELAPAAVDAATGSLHVQTDPPKQAVMVDGTERGLSPLVIDALGVGQHEVAVRTSGGLVRRTVQVDANESVSLIVSATDAGAVQPGWLKVTSPVAMQLLEDGKVIGSTDLDRLMLTAGDHAIEVVNDALGYRSRRSVRVSPGKTTTVALDLPEGTISINALPWADVWIDGERVGQTPIGKLSRTIGPHEIVLRHPQLGERRQTVTITTQGTARFGVDLRKQ
jgi:hypothetical protein